ncbi:D-alanyl-D-alanine carboxypeptidase [Clostridia bacterium]
MKKIIHRWKSALALLTAVCLLGAGLALPAAADSPYKLPDDLTVASPAALVVYLGLTPEQDTVLFEKNADEVRAPAALVRLMVGAYALKLIEENNIDVATATGTYEVWMFNSFVAGTGISTANMDFGETWTIKDLLAASLLQTAGDAAVTLAATLSPTGKVGDFVKGMNAYAKELGCTHTSFANVTGLDALTQYTTPRDIYRIMRTVMDYPLFNTLTKKVWSYDINPTAKGKPWTLTTGNSMMKPSSPYYYEPMQFGRTGFTDLAGWCLASVASAEGYDYMVIVMGCPEKAADGTLNPFYLDTKALYKWAFNSFTYKPVLTKNEILAHVGVNLAWSKDKVPLVPKEEFATVVYNALKSEDILPKITLYKQTVDAPVEKGTVYGKVELYVNLDQKIGEVELVAGESVEQSQILAVWEKVRGFLSSPWFYAGIGLLVGLLVLYIILNIVHNRNRRKNNMQKVKKYK